ncbi:MAG TPA: hypothetical protein VGO40_04990 [Longimicrobium sp.]|jgi:hypothetical protein|nr:hypothetical protein [Longimicrobium sp.]
MVFAGRGGGGTGRYLEWKIRLFFVAAVLFLVGIARELDLLVLLSILMLAGAFVLRFFERPPPPVDDDEDEGDDEDGGDDGHQAGSERD